MVVLVLFSLACGMIGAVLAPLIFQPVRMFVTQSMRSDYLATVFAPVFGNSSTGLYPVHSNVAATGAAVGALAGVLAPLLFALFYPASQKLANRLAQHSVAVVIVTFGAIAPLLDPELVAAIQTWRSLSSLMSMGAIAAASGILLIPVVFLERRTIALLGNVFDVDRPHHRLALWLARYPITYGSLATLCVFSDWIGGAIACGAVCFATLVEDLVHFPKSRFEKLDQPKMFEGLAAVVIVALVLVASSAWTFGLRALDFRAQAVVIEGGSASLVSIESLKRRISSDVAPRLEMKWSNEK